MEAAQQPLLPGSAGFQPPKTPSMARGKLPPLPVPSLPMIKTQLGTKQDLCHPQREISVPTGHQVGIGVFLGREFWRSHLRDGNLHFWGREVPVVWAQSQLPVDPLGASCPTLE